MTSHFTALTLGIVSGGGIDDSEMGELIQNLREDLLQTDVESVESVRGTEAPPGAKGDPLTLAALALTLAPTALTGLITMLQSWLTRHERTTLTLRSGERQITVTGTLSKDQQQVLAEWLHADKTS